MRHYFICMLVNLFERIYTAALGGGAVTAIKVKHINVVMNPMTITFVHSPLDAHDSHQTSTKKVTGAVKTCKTLNIDMLCVICVFNKEEQIRQGKAERTPGSSGDWGKPPVRQLI